jgi:hypothetical protein
LVKHIQKILNMEKWAVILVCQVIRN